MGNLIRTVGNGVVGGGTTLKRTVGVLSDGSVVMMVPDLNQTGVSGDGGDNTGIPKIHFYHSTDRVNWTLKNTINLPAAAPGVVASMVVDSGNNIHLVYKGNNNLTIWYVKGTWAAGPAWTFPAATSVATALTGYNSMSLLDIDTMGNSTDAVVIGSYWYQSTGAKKTAFQSYARATTGGAWVAHAPVVAINGDMQLGYTDDLTISGDNIGGLNGTTGYFSWYVTRKGSSGTDFGDLLYVTAVNTTTGAFVSQKVAQSGIYKGSGGGYRKFWLFNTAANTWTLAGVVDGLDFRTGVYRFSYNRSTQAVTSITPVTTSAGRAPATAQARGSAGSFAWSRTNAHNWAAVAYNGNDEVFFFVNGGGQAVLAASAISGGTVKDDAGYHRWDNGYGYPGGTWDTDGKFKAPTVAPLRWIHSGATRNLSTSAIDVLLFHNREGSGTPQSWNMESRSLRLPLAPDGITPSVNSTVTTDRPTVGANIRLPSYYPQMRVKSQWQIASDAGFTTNLKTITESDSDFEAATATSSPYNGTAKHTEVLAAIYELTQGTWYIRARTQDYSGNFGPYSSSNTFTITHPPVAADMYPNAGVVFLYAGVGNVTFTWKFTDPSPYDSQTAYQVTVEDASNGTVLVDSGKVLTSSKSATLAIPVGGKDIELRWKVRLWDSDDVVGPDSSYQAFYVADPPAPVINSPANAAVLSTGTPTVTWTPGIGGSKSQARYRVLVTQGVNVLYNSQWIDSNATSHTIPVGYLGNSQSYTFRVEVQDTLTLQGFAEITVSTDWVEPVGPANNWAVYLNEYAKRGFVYITWTDANMDPDFSSWNVYRRQRGDSAWTQIATVSSGAGRYAHRDYLVGNGRTYEYTITQMVNRFGDLVESIPTKIVRVQPDGDNYWLIDPVVPSQSIPLYTVVDDPFQEEYEQETIHIIGAGRHVEYGDRLGYAGSLASQLRDKFVSGIARENYVLNPALSYQSTNGAIPDRWTFASTGNIGNVTMGYYEVENPSPSGKTPYRVYSDALGNTSNDNIRLQQNINGSDFPDKMKVAGTQVVLSVWIAMSPLNADKKYQLSLQWMDPSGTLLTPQANSPFLDAILDAVETYIPSGGPDAGSGNSTEIWRRLSFTTTVPVSGTGVGGVAIRIRIAGAGGSAASPGELIFGGVQLETTPLTAYFDGDQLGGSWSGQPYLSYSYGNGYYTARQQRQALERIKAQKTWVYLRNPFGDIWKVAPGNISVKRLAGVGKSEFVDVSIPYEEVGF